MPRLAWISVETPDVRGGGGQRRQFHQLKVLLERGVDIRITTLASPQDDASIRALAPITRFHAQRLRGLLPSGSLARILDELHPDGVVLAHTESVPLVLKDVVHRGIPILVDFQNVYSRYYERMGCDGRADLWRRREREALAGATHATACSLEEVEALRALDPSATIEVAPQGVDPEEWPEAALAVERAPVVAFFGSLTHRPNQEGLCWLVERVWPHIVAAVPDARLLVFGPGEPHIRPQPGIDLCGRVDDLPRALGAVRVVAVPIVHGVGTRVKFVEALASGGAVVATSVGAEGFGVTDGFVCADEPEPFAHACVELLRDPTRANDLGRAGRKLALEKLTWHRAAAAQFRFTEEL